MRRLVLIAVLSVVSAFTVTALSSPAEAQARYCLQGRHWGFPGNCQFATFSQCRASAAGTHATCGINPQYAARQNRGR